MSPFVLLPRCANDVSKLDEDNQLEIRLRVTVATVATVATGATAEGGKGVSTSSVLEVGYFGLEALDEAIRFLKGVALRLVAGDTPK